MIPQPIAQQAVMDAVSHGPQSIPQLAAAVLNVGERTEFIYATARLAVRALLDARRVEECQIINGPIIYRLPASTPIEKNPTP